MENIFDKLDRVSLTDRVLLLTHVDMDAAGAEILCRLTFNNLTVRNLSNNEMSKGILNAVIEETELDFYDKHDIIIVDDISCNIDDAEEIDRILRETGISLVLLDHHDTAIQLNKFSWALVKPNMFKEACIASKYDSEQIEKAHSSGASLLYDYLVINDIMERTPFLDEFMHLIAAYDTWDWHYLFNDNERYSFMDKLCDSYGMQMFVNEMTKRANENYTSREIFNDKDLTLLTIQKNKANEHIERIKKAIKEAELTLENGTKTSLVYCFTSEYVQETFEYMKKAYPGKDLYAINFGTSISLRTENEDIHLGELARELYSGGGHPGAAGFPIPKELVHDYMEKTMHGTITYIENGGK